MSNRFEILVVDDDKEDHVIMLDYFKEFGIGDKVRFIENGKSAIQYLENVSEDEFLPQLIVLDLNMPILNGTQTLLQIKETPRYRNIPVIIFSTSENETEKRKCLSFGAVDYMIKPATLEEGEQTIRKFSSFIS